MPTVEERAKPDAVSAEGAEVRDFSLVLGGPLYQFFRKTRLAGDVLELALRRVLLIPMIVWLPVAILSGVDLLFGQSARISFFMDLEVQVRFLVALPILIVAELVVHQRITPLVRRFVERRMIADEDRPRFQQAIHSAVRLRNSIPVELSLILLVYVLGFWIWNGRGSIETPTWYAHAGSRWNLTPAGYWYVFLSIPMTQFILLRWYLRLFIWYRFLWQVSRIKLQLIASHPDRCGGLAFLGRSVYAFSPLVFAQGAILAGMVGSRVLYMGQNLVSFKLQIAGFVAFFVFAVLGPLVMFTPQMAATKRKALAEYGQFAQDYVENFERKWIRRDPDTGEDMLGSGDIQSLADLGNSYSVVSDMRAIPFGLQDISRLALATAVPFLPLLLTVFSPDELLMRLVKIVF
ncbi:MAG TPA: hypothetical protein VGL22_19195 [Terracidiphilus sp.]